MGGHFSKKRDARSEQETSPSAGIMRGCFPKKRGAHSTQGGPSSSRTAGPSGQGQSAARERPSFYSMSDVPKHLNSLMELRPEEDALYFYWRCRTRDDAPLSSHDFHVLLEMEKEFKERLRRLAGGTLSERVKHDRLLMLQNIMDEGRSPLHGLNPQLRPQLTTRMRGTISDFNIPPPQPEIIIRFVGSLFNHHHYLVMGDNS